MQPVSHLGTGRLQSLPAQGTGWTDCGVGPQLTLQWAQLGRWEPEAPARVLPSRRSSDEEGTTAVQSHRIS